MGVVLVIIDHLYSSVLKNLEGRLGSNWRGIPTTTAPYHVYQSKQNPGSIAGIFIGFDISIPTKNPTTTARSQTGFSFVPLGEKMLAPNPNLPRFTSPQTAFENLVEDAICQGVSHKQTYQTALQLGLDPVEMCRYAAASMSDDEREGFQSMFASQPWVMSRIVALVKGSRKPGLAFNIIELAKTKTTSFDILSCLATDLDRAITNDPELSLAKVLDSLV